MAGYASKGRGLRVGGALFLALAALVLVIDAASSLAAGGLALKPLGAWWAALHTASLNLFQVVVQRYIEPYTISGIWFGVIQPILLWPAALDFAGLGAFLFGLGVLRGRWAR